MDSKHVSAQAALPLELLEADVAVVSGSLMLSLDVHITTSRGPEFLAAPLARIHLKKSVLETTAFLLPVI